ncbi:OmpA family protein [Rhodoblastus sp.]|uniref:OmpA family protein n=1 Tax=Rhodoblastus sp. TaxID=1962975 RepID=UPI003F97608D
MALFDALINDIATRFGLGSNAAPLVREVLNLIVEQPRGLTGFLEKLKSVGLGSEIASWLGNPAAAALPTQLIEGALGSSLLGGLASKLGLSSSIVTPALAYVVPKLVGLLTPGGVIPATLPTAVSGFLSAAPVAAQPVPHHAEASHETTKSGNPWLWPALLSAGILALAAFLMNQPAPEQKVVNVAPAPVATPAPAPMAAMKPAPVVPAPTLPAQLSLSNDNGVIHYSGSVHDEATRSSILDQLKSAFGADKIVGEIAVDANRMAASWTTNLGPALDHFKHPGLKASFSGNSLNLGGIAQNDINEIMSYLKNLFGGGWSFGLLGDKASEAAAANAKVAAALASLKSGFNPKELLDVLNMSVIVFPTSGFELPASEEPLMQQAAALLKQLPPGTVVEIAGYTDNTGDATANVTLSQNRADSIRKALVGAGVDGSTLVSKGYGEANPVASNDTEDGRSNNRRIEYHIAK